MYKFLTRNNTFAIKNVQNILKDFGIVNPNIARNLRLSPHYLVLQNSMSKECNTNLLTPSPNTTISPATELLLPTLD
jgi:hypothetical protein